MTAYRFSFLSVVTHENLCLLSRCASGTQLTHNFCLSVKRGWGCHTFIVVVACFRFLSCFAEMLTFILLFISSQGNCPQELEPTAQRYLLQVFFYGCSTNHQWTVFWTIWLKVSILPDPLFLWASSLLLVRSFVAPLCFFSAEPHSYPQIGC